ncbi:MFS transporter, partial [Actinoplanes sp. NPDC048791]
AGLASITLGQFLLVACAGAFNPTFATYRMQATEDGYLARVFAAWSISSRVAQPAGIAASGLLAAATSVRTALFVLAGAVLISAALLPWRTPAAETAPAAGELTDSRS